jgi:hypothetical protein
MSNKKQPPVWIVVLFCSAAGVVLGGSASWAESNQCLQETNVTTQCLTQDPVKKTSEGMIAGMVAGAGAAVGATWSKRSL